MDYHHIKIPHAVTLTREDSWESVPELKYAYFMVRMHYILRERQVNEPVRSGEKISAYFTPGKTEIETLRSVEFDHTWMRTEETIRSSLQEVQSVMAFVQQLSTGVDLVSGMLSADIQRKAQESFRESLVSTLRVETIETKKMTTKFEVRQTFKPKLKENIVAVATYQRCAFDVYLHYYDYLFVEYRRSILGLRKKRRKIPRPVGNEHINREKLNWPVGSIHYWKLLPGSARLLPESEYQNEVEDPFECEVYPLTEVKHFPLPKRPERPTLYQLSNVAFPLRWVDRKGDWTVEALKAIELEEAKDTAWFWKYGPGRKQGKKSGIKVYR